jgi:hypothetical protein
MDRCGYDALWVEDHIAFAVPIRDPLQQLEQACFDGSIVALDGTGEHNANNLGILDSGGDKFAQQTPKFTAASQSRFRATFIA